MVIGNGLMAKTFSQYETNENVLIFASGVSNSLETNEEEFKRERDLLEKSLRINKNKIIVYFSSYIGSSPTKKAYAKHKQNMVSLVKSSSNYWCILVLPQVVGRGGNENTLINYLVNKIKNKEPIDVYKNTVRALIDVNDVRRIYDVIYNWKDLNICFHMPYIEQLYIEDIVKLIGKKLKIEPIINLVEGEVPVNRELTIAANLIINKHLRIKREGYTKRLIEKYIK